MREQKDAVFYEIDRAELLNLMRQVAFDVAKIPRSALPGKHSRPS